MTLTVYTAWRCQACNHFTDKMCGECNLCGEDQGYKRSVSFRIIR